MKPVFALLGALCLTACAGPQLKPEIHTVYQQVEVKVPVREKCSVTLPAEPSWLTEQLPSTASDLEYSQAVLGELEQRRQYETLLRAEAKKCE